ncbi:alcohol acetyltransferase [Umbelopsis sp. PMI_123]|nr:alcohol acetyltransferase [Umbelopsis sp. PMI_123]
MTNQCNNSRPLGLLEKFQLGKRFADCYGTVNLAAHLQHTASRPAQDETSWYLSRLVPAIQRICDEQPLLVSVVAKYDTAEAHWIQLEKIDVLDIVDFKTISLQDPSSIETLIAQQCGYYFNLGDTTKPLWKLCIASDPEDLNRTIIVFTWDHVICDGMSSTLFFDRFLDYLNTTNVAENTETTFTVKEINEFPTPFDQRSPPTPKLFTEVIPKAFKVLLLPSFITRYSENELWRGQHKAKEETHKTRVRILELDTEMLMIQCKAENSTPHSAIYVAAMMAASSELMDGYAKLATKTPINARSLSKPEVPHDEIGNFVGSFERTVRFPLKGSFWEESRRYRADLKDGRYDAGKASAYLRYLGAYPEEFKKYMTGPFSKYKIGRGGGIEFSDLALWNNQTGKGEWNLEKATFCQSINVYDTALTMNSVTVGNKLRVAITWQDGTLDVDRLDKFVAKINDILKEQCQ